MTTSTATNTTSTVARFRKNLGPNTIKVWYEGTQPYGQNASPGETAGPWTWHNGSTGQRRRVYFEGDTLYSYGPHFPLAIRMRHPDDGRVFYLLNGDYASSTTSKHQREVQWVTQKDERYIIPFSALERAGVEPTALVPLDQEAERTWTETFKSRRRIYTDENGKWDYRAPKRYTPWEERTVERHLLGAVLFRADVTHRKYTEGWGHDETETRYYLSGLDETGFRPEESYFLTQLPGVCATVAQAKEMLKPFEIRERDARGEGWVRQGDWFFYPVTELEQDHLSFFERADARGASVHPVEHQRALPSRNAREDTRHIATRFVEWHGGYYVRGTVTHTGPDHKRLSFGKVWHRAIQNRQVVSYTAGGSGSNRRTRVD